MVQTGKFFVIEGLDGSGKTTVINRLKKDFPNLIYTREPGGSIFGEMVRNVLLDSRSKNVPPLPMLLGFISARASHYEELILPNLLEGKTVVSDRFDASTFAFQLYGQENQDLIDVFEFLRTEILQTEYGRNVKPRYVYLRLANDVAKKRREGRSEKGNHFDHQTDDYYTRVFQGYEDFFREVDQKASNLISSSENKVQIIDASLDLETVYNNVKKYIENETKLRL